MSFLRTIPAALTAALLASPAALAETVTLTLLNGDTIQGELIPEESTDDMKVLMHPQLGRLEVSQDALKPVEKPPAWKTTLSAGIMRATKMGMARSQPISTAAAITGLIVTSSSSKPV